MGIEMHEWRGQWSVHDMVVDDRVLASKYVASGPRDEICRVEGTAETNFETAVTDLWKSTWQTLAGFVLLLHATETTVQQRNERVEGGRAAYLGVKLEPTDD